STVSAMPLVTWSAQNTLIQPMSFVRYGGGIGAASQVSATEGTMRVQVRPPAAGPADPLPLLTYKAESGGVATEFGTGWNDSYKRKVAANGPSAANLTPGQGGAAGSYAYTALDATTKYYTPPTDAKNSLHQE